MVTVFQLIKRGFIEIPEMMGGAVIAISGRFYLNYIIS